MDKNIVLYKAASIYNVMLSLLQNDRHQSSGLVSHPELVSGSYETEEDPGSSPG